MARLRARWVPSLHAAAFAIAIAVGACAPAAPAGSSTGTIATGAPTPTQGPSEAPGGGFQPSASAFLGMLVTTSTVDPITWYGERCDPLDPEWLVTGETASDGYAESWTYTATIDPATLQGTYVYEAYGEIAGGTITKKGAGSASVLESDGTATLTVDAANVTGTIVAGGTTQTVTLPVPSTAFTFVPAPREDCP